MNDKIKCIVTRTVFVTHSLAFSLSKGEREFRKRSHSFLLKKTSEGEMANLREDNLMLTIPKYLQVSSLVLILVIKQAIGLHIEKAKKISFFGIRNVSLPC